MASPRSNEEKVEAKATSEGGVKVGTPLVPRPALPSLTPVDDDLRKEVRRCDLKPLTQERDKKKC
jgi:hypothetical protein